jgi:beta-alanine--pyruvate transaminase
MTDPNYHYSLLTLISLICRNYGLMGAVELEAVPGFPAKRGADIFERCFQKGAFVRVTGSTLAFSPPLICEKQDLDRIVHIVGDAIIESSKFMKV